MNKVSVVKVALFLLMMGVVAGLSPILILSADTNNPAISITNPSAGDATSSGGTIAEACRNVNDELLNEEYWADEFLTYSFNTSANAATITVNMVHYRKLENAEKQKTMQVALDGIYNSTISRTAKNKIYNELCALDESTSALVRELSNDVHADFAKAYTYFKPFSGPIGIVLGFLSLVLFALLGFTLIFDIAYITIPMVQSGLEQLGSTDKPFGVSYEAQKAVKEQASKSGIEYVNPLTVYLKTKTVQFVAIFVCLLYLMSGKLYVWLGNMMDYFSGLLG